MRTFFNKFRNSQKTAEPSSSSNSARQQPKNSRESSIDSCSEVAPEITPMEKHEKFEVFSQNFFIYIHTHLLKEIIGEVVDINDRFITLETNQTGDEYKIAKEKYAFDLIL